MLELTLLTNVFIESNGERTLDLDEFLNPFVSMLGVLLGRGRGRRDESDNIARIELILWVQKDMN